MRRHLAQPNTGVCVVQQDGVILWASPSMQQVTGRAPAQLVGANGWALFVRPEDLGEVARFKAGLTHADGVLWLPDRIPATPPRWFRIDAWLESGHILAAFHLERDPAEHRLHFVQRPRVSG